MFLEVLVIAIVQWTADDVFDSPVFHGKKRENIVAKRKSTANHGNPRKPTEVWKRKSTEISEHLWGKTVEYPISEYPGRCPSIKHLPWSLKTAFSIFRFIFVTFTRHSRRISSPFRHISVTFCAGGGVWPGGFPGRWYNMLYHHEWRVIWGTFGST